MQAQRSLHPMLFAAYFILFAYAHNFEFAPPVGVILFILAVAIGLVTLMWGALTLLTHNGSKAAIATTALLLVFVSYGHVKNLITAWSWDFHVFSLQIGYIKMAAVVCLVFAVFVARWLRVASPDATRVVTTVLNGAGSALVLISVAHVLTAELFAHSASRLEHRPRDVAAPGSQAGAQSLDRPDIYYIILDTYGRSDVLRDLYAYDNGAFIEWLRQEGFYVATESHSNYSQTMLSLASSLNLMYLDPVELTTAAATVGDARWRVSLNSAAIQLLNSVHQNQLLPLAHLIQQNLAVRTLRSHGYRFVAFTSGYGGVQFPDADVTRHASVMSDFQESLISTTPLPDLFDRVYDQRELQRQRVRYVFEHLADSTSGDGPVFVFAHIMSPHSPFVFQANGAPAPRRLSKPENWYDDTIDPDNPAEKSSFVEGYRDQVEFVSRQIQRVVEAILSDTTRRRIIVLQGDHGPNMALKLSGPSSEAVTERMAILNAYYVPSEIRARLYPSITPVNTFRIILGQYFGEPGDLLPDRSYLSPSDPYVFVDVTNKIEPTGPVAATPPEQSAAHP